MLTDATLTLRRARLRHGTQPTKAWSRHGCCSWVDVATTGSQSALNASDIQGFIVSNFRCGDVTSQHQCSQPVIGSKVVIVDKFVQKMNSPILAQIAVVPIIKEVLSPREYFTINFCCVVNLDILLIDAGTCLIKVSKILLRNDLREVLVGKLMYFSLLISLMMCVIIRLLNFLQGLMRLRNMRLRTLLRLTLLFLRVLFL
ncbi:uncharacterized protein LOC120171091 [Hibiscus syriacus]|uniref:uncharacterized protein LOC120171091 n=1 Tax=Hibiscus syriacus TaxID=106335 RepID=UPI0019210D4E|nr:uncharacterized protein LOC120171091 [Hibiscus syriacus]